MSIYDTQQSQPQSQYLQYDSTNPFTVQKQNLGNDSSSDSEESSEGTIRKRKIQELNITHQKKIDPDDKMLISWIAVAIIVSVFFALTIVASVIAYEQLNGWVDWIAVPPDIAQGLQINKIFCALGITLALGMSTTALIIRAMRQTRLPVNQQTSNFSLSNSNAGNSSNESSETPKKNHKIQELNITCQDKSDDTMLAAWIAIAISISVCFALIILTSVRAYVELSSWINWIGIPPMQGFQASIILGAVGIAITMGSTLIAGVALEMKEEANKIND